MSRKSLLYLGATVGSTIGGFIPSLMGVDWLSAWGILGSGVGGILGVWGMYKLADRYGL